MTTLELLPDGRTLVSGGKDGAVMLWDTATDRQQDAAIGIPDAPVAWQFSAAGDAVVAVEAAGRAVGQVVERSGNNFQEEKLWLDLTPHAFQSAMLARDRPLVAAWSPNKGIKAWDWRRAALIREFSTGQEEVSFSVVGFGRGGETIRILRRRREQPATLEEWGLGNGQKIREWKTPPFPMAVAVSPDERFFVTTFYDARTTQLRPEANDGEGFMRTEMTTGHETVLHTNTRETARAGGGAFSPDGKFFAHGSVLGFVDVIDVASWQNVVRLTGTGSGMYAPRFSRDSARVAVSGSGENSLTIWDAATFERLLTLPTSSSRLMDAAFSPDGNWVGAVSSAGGAATPGSSGRGRHYFWRAPSWAEIAAAEKEMTESSVAATPGR